MEPALTAILLLFLIVEMISSMSDDMCFPAAANSASARPVLFQGSTETERRCKVLCGDNTECVAVSYIAPNCLLLGAVNATMKCSNPAPEVNVKSTTGCPARSNMTSGIDNPPDKYVDYFPGKTKLNQNGICPRDANNFVVRGIDEFGNRVTLDNDINNKLTFNANRNLWKFYHASSGFTLWFLSVSCAVHNFNCPCLGIPGIQPNLVGGVGPKLETTGVCADPEHRISFVPGKEPPGTLPVSYDAVEAVKMTLTCSAGIWLLNYVNNQNGWQVLNATCAP